MRLAPSGLLARAADAMSRSEPQDDVRRRSQPAWPRCWRLRAPRLRSAVAPALGVEARRLAEHIRESMRYFTHVDTTPSEDSVQAAMLVALAKPEAVSWDVLRQDLWSVSDLLYS